MKARARRGVGTNVEMHVGAGDRHASYVLQRMEPEHLEEVLAIERASYTNPWPEDAFVHEVASNPVGSTLVALTARARRAVAGYAVTWIIFENMHLQNVAVHPDHRRLGVARLLLERAFDDAVARKATVALLEVRTSNAPARELYRSLGFVEDGVRPDYYSRPMEDAILYRRELEDRR